MATTLYGLKNCDTCKKATKWLDRFGVPYTFVDYRDDRQSPETLRDWATKAGGWDTLINKSSTTWRQKLNGTIIILSKSQPPIILRPAFFIVPTMVAVRPAMDTCLPMARSGVSNNLTAFS